jgi:exodeoxyribonuclease VII small subunit
VTDTEAPAKPPSGEDAAGAPDFERSLAELEALVQQMEQGELSLEESLAHFERGIALTRACQQALRRAEQKVEILLGEGGRDEDVAPFRAED